MGPGGDCGDCGGAVDAEHTERLLVVPAQNCDTLSSNRDIDRLLGVWCGVVWYDVTAESHSVVLHASTCS